MLNVSWLHHDKPVEALGAECACGIDDLDGFAPSTCCAQGAHVAGDGGGEGVPLVGFEVVGVFEAIGPGGLSAAEGLPVSVGSRGFARRLWRNGDPCVCIPVADLSSWLRRSTLAGSCGSVPRVPRATVEGARSSCASGDAVAVEGRRNQSRQ